jgi:hypothetical protein
MAQKITKKIRLKNRVSMEWELEKGFTPRIHITGLGLPASPIDLSMSSLEKIRTILQLDADLQEGRI